MRYYDSGYFGQNDFTLFGDVERFWALLERFIHIVPKDIIDDVRSNCVFLMMDTERLNGACFIRKDLIERKSVIVFHDMLYDQDEDKQCSMILHEIAHYVLGHSGALSEEEYRKREKEANSLRDEWINDWENHLKGEQQRGL
jgi:hypothetical protein